MSSLHIKNYWQDNSKAVKKVLLWLKAMTGMMVGSAYIQGNIKLCFYIMVAAGVLDGLLQLLPPANNGGGQQQPGAQASAQAEVPAPTGIPPAAVVAALTCMFWTASCTVIKPATNTRVVDSVSTTYTPVDYHITGAKVSKGINIDSLYRVVLRARNKHLADSVAYLKQRNQWLADSLTAARANKPLPPKPLLIPAKPVIQYLTDPATKAQLSYYVDAFGRLNVGCEAKDRTIQVLQQTVTRLQKQVSQTTQVAYKTPWYMWGLLGLLAGLLGISLVKNLIKF